MQDIPALLQALRLSPAILFQFVTSIPEERLNIRRGEGFWTVAEHVNHLAQVQPMMLERFRRFIKEEHPVFVPFIPGAQDEPATPQQMTTTAALEQFARYREMQLELLEEADQGVWRRTGTHPEYEAYSLYIVARHLLMHDHWHMYRMEELWLTKDEYLTHL